MNLISKSQYILTLCQAEGNLIFDGHKKTAGELRNESGCRNLCREIEQELRICKAEDIPGLLEVYDMLHRIGYGRQPDRNFIKTMRQRVITAWERNKREVKESTVYPLLDRGRKDEMLRDWLKILMRYNRFSGETTMENYRRLTLLIHENIDDMLDELEFYNNHNIFEDSEELKWNLYKSNRADNLSILSTPLLKVYRSFIASLFPAVIDYEDQQELDAEILTELLTRPDLPLHDRKAYTITLSLSTTRHYAS